MQVNYKKFEKALKKLGEDKPIETLSVEDILELHNLAIEYFGGEAGVRDKNLLESVAVTPAQSCFGQDLYPTVFDKAAKYLLDFSRYQVFVDGNKRTGVLAMQEELISNGYDLVMTNERVYELTLDIANNRVTEVNDIADVLREHSVFYDPEKTSEDLIEEAEKAEEDKTL